MQNNLIKTCIMLFNFLQRVSGFSGIDFNVLSIFRIVHINKVFLRLLLHDLTQCILIRRRALFRQPIDGALIKNLRRNKQHPVCIREMNWLTNRQYNPPNWPNKILI